MCHAELRPLRRCGRCARPLSCAWVLLRRDLPCTSPIDSTTPRLDSPAPYLARPSWPSLLCLYFFPRIRVMTDVDAFCPQPITVSAILSYCGSSLVLGTNYSLLVINLLGLGALHRRFRSIATMNDSSSSSARTHRPPSLGSALLSLGFGE